MSNENWSDWIEWSGGECPLPEGTLCDVRYKEGRTERNLPANKNAVDRIPDAGPAFWNHNGLIGDIIAYRYRIEEPTRAAEGIMYDDLFWLAKNVHTWHNDYTHLAMIDDWISGQERFGRFNNGQGYTRDQWLQARKDLGIETDRRPVMTPEEEADCHKEQGLKRVMGQAVDDSDATNGKYSPYFKDVRHIDTLDVYRTIDLFGCEKHGHPISHAVKKLLLSGVRTGGKDVEKDVSEAIDSLLRWKEMRKEDEGRG